MVFSMRSLMHNLLVAHWVVHLVIKRNHFVALSNGLCQRPVDRGAAPIEERRPEHREKPRKMGKGRAITSRGKAPTSHAPTFAPRKTIAHCNRNQFAPIRSRSVTAIPQLLLCSS